MTRIETVLFDGFDELDAIGPTTNRGVLDDLRAAGADVVDERVVDDGDVITAGGLTAGLDLGLWLVEREAGAELAADVARSIADEPRTEVARR